MPGDRLLPAETTAAEASSGLVTKVAAKYPPKGVQSIFPVNEHVFGLIASPPLPELTKFTKTSQIVAHKVPKSGSIGYRGVVF
jgi:hypothetical protein